MKSSKSFYEWCIENDRRDLIDRWDYELNLCSPRDVTYGSSRKKYYFKCQNHTWHNSTAIQISSITCNGSKIICEQCASFAQWVVDSYDESYLERIWNKDLNNKSPWQIYAKSHCDIFLNCDKVEYHTGYKTTPSRFTGGQKVCGFCHGLQIHPLDSFAARNIKKYGDNFLNDYWDYEKNTVDPWHIASKSGIYVWIKCADVTYHDSYRVKANDFSSDRSKCPYCRGLKVHMLDSIGYKYPQIFDIWSDESLSPYDCTLGTGKKAWFKCENNIHEDYFRSIREVLSSEFHCPECTRLRKESLLEENTRLYISKQYSYDLYHEYNCSIIATNPLTGRKLPYDNEVVMPNGQHLIIEVHGKQHFDTTAYTLLSATKENKSPEVILEEQKQRDIVKKEYVLSLVNYHFLELPYWVFKDESYKTLIDNKIKEVLTIQN